ncbi:MAG TPA: UDP-3-O-(3-hydroxymyristoyl)glucosamine N-acyltransferase [Candidatus Limnocylindrales bacterium]|nr:UDP-3-O-(3-hydroxymyristoyl)glucosamine N-acyltransferase [Candidatus Limnocylindrales bacterium]
MKLKDIAQKLGASLHPPAADLDITGVAAIESATPGQITFIANPKYAAAAKTTQASAIIVDEKFPDIDKPALRTRNPQFAYARAVELFYQLPRYAPGIHPTAVVDPSAKIGSNASIGPYAVIDAGVVIGENCTLLPHVVIYRGAKIGNNFFAHSHVSVREFCEIGDNVLLHNGVVIGADGFGFAKDDQGRWYKILQSGKVVIEDNVEVQANSCIDRASLGETRIGRGVKIDNLVQVGHNCTVGENSMLCAQVGLAGSTEIGKNVILAGQVGVAGHCKIGDGAIATAQTGIPNDVGPGKLVSGYPAIDNRQWLRSVAVFNKLPELARAVRKLAGGKEEV